MLVALRRLVDTSEVTIDDILAFFLRCLHIKQPFRDLR